MSQTGTNIYPVALHGLLEDSSDNLFLIKLRTLENKFKFKITAMHLIISQRAKNCEEKREREGLTGNMTISPGCELCFERADMDRRAIDDAVSKPRPKRTPTGYI